MKIEPDPHATAYERAIVDAARALSEILGRPEAERLQEASRFDDFIHMIGNDGRCLLVHWIDVFRPEPCRLIFRREKPPKGRIV